MTTRPYHHGIPAEILALSHERDLLRRKGQYARADVLKQQIEDAGFAVKDNPHGAHLVILPSIIVDGTHYRTIRQLPSLLNATDLCTFSVNILAHNTQEQTQRCIESILQFAGDTSIEILLVDNASQDGLDLWAESLHHQDPRVHLIRSTRKMGVAEARNVGLKQNRGRYVLFLSSTAEATGDIFKPLATTLSQEGVGLTGARGLHTDDLRHFEETQDTEVEAIDGSCMAFKRSLLKQTGWLDEHFRYPQYMDIDFSFAIRDQDVSAITTPELPLIFHPELQSATLSDAERTRVTKRNFYCYLQKWGDRDDLLLYEDVDEEDEEGRQD